MDSLPPIFHNFFFFFFCHFILFGQQKISHFHFLIPGSHQSCCEANVPTPNGNIYLFEVPATRYIY